MIKTFSKDGEILLILEPGNVTLLQQGKPLTINLEEIGREGKIELCWTPDAVRMALEMNLRIQTKGEIDREWLADKLQESLSWKVQDRVAN